VFVPGKCVRASCGKQICGNEFCIGRLQLLVTKFTSIQPTLQVKMNRAELVERIVLENDISKAVTGRVLDTLIGTIQSTVRRGNTVTLVGFGTFKPVKRAARVGKNPRTGVAVAIPAGIVPKFTPGSKFRAAVNPQATLRKTAGYESHRGAFA
jgi:DNA-binding protein HU-beta